MSEESPEYPVVQNPGNLVPNPACDVALEWPYGIVPKSFIDRRLKKKSDSKEDRETMKLAWGLLRESCCHVPRDLRTAIESAMEKLKDRINRVAETPPKSVEEIIAGPSFFATNPELPPSANPMAFVSGAATGEWTTPTVADWISIGAEARRKSDQLHYEFDVRATRLYLGRREDRAFKEWIYSGRGCVDFHATNPTPRRTYAGLDVFVVDAESHLEVG